MIALNPDKGIVKTCLVLLLSMFLLRTSVNAQPCVSQSAPSPQMGAMMSPQFTNLWTQASVSDKHGQYFKNEGTCSIGDDGWPIAGKVHGLRFYPQDILPTMKGGDILKIRYKGANDAFTFDGLDQWQCKYQNVQNGVPTVGYTTLELVLKPGFLDPGVNGFYFKFRGHIEDIEIVRPGYDFDDPRFITDEYVQHSKMWTAFRYMGLLSAPSNFGQTWAKRVSQNAPININTFEWSAPNCDNPEPQFTRFSEDVVPFKTSDGRVDGMWSPGAPWETVIDISNYLNKDMWITIPTLADDNYVLQLSKLIKQRLKPTLNVHVEIGNELWNTGPPFMGFYMLRQALGDEWNQKNPEKLKILGGQYCPGCELEESENANRAGCQNNDWTANQRWMARRLKEMMEQFAIDWGWKAEGGVGSRIRATLAGQIGYGSEGHGWNIGRGLEFLMKAYGPDAPSKYLYSVSVAAYFQPGGDGPFNKSASIEEIAQNYATHPMKYIFGEFATEVWNNTVHIGNQAEGIFALARLCGLKMYAYEGGNEIGNGGEGGSWIDYDNDAAAMKDPRFGNVNTDLLNEWFSWFGYDALFMKNGDHVGEIGAYSMSEQLNENNAMRLSYLKVANSAAPPLSKKRGGVIGIPAVAVLDARKPAAYREDWEKGPYNIWHKGYRTEANNDFTLKSNDNWSPPMIIRCEKTGTYKLELERAQMGGGSNANKADDDKFPTYCDIYLNEKLIKSGVKFGLATFSRKTVEQRNEPIYWWTEAVEIDIPY
ncbi:MAG TPA: hypothetical protein VF691_04720, partial [Cytophagaceae bacterium]